MQRDPAAASSMQLRAAVARALDAHVPAQAPVAVALSGGRDSVVLLDAVVAVAGPRGHPLCAVHVHHGISAHADAWAAFCAALCSAQGVTLHTRHITVPREPQHSLESEARRRRYAALAEAATAAGARVVLLGHHRDDQAETLLLQLLRGAGPKGLAAMPAARADPSGIVWLRPLLDVTRAQVDAYANACGLRWIDDDSNSSDVFVRNALRQRVMPALASVNAAYSATLARAATHQADAVRLLEDLAQIDAAAAGHGETLDLAAIAAMPMHRARNLLRWFVRRHGLPAPSTARTDAMLAQLRTARADATIRLAHAGMELGVHRGRIVVHAAPPVAYDVRWRGEAEVALPHGRLHFTRTRGSGIDATRLATTAVWLRSRRGGERLQLAANRPRRALKAILRDAGIAPWERAALPLVFCGDDLVAVAGFAVDAEYAAGKDADGIAIAWHPATSR